ncbi:cbb3-type cytochrome oxidase assembly protein CcoS [Rubrivirga sp. S365]|uniref:cbb3-type cytochrome oxidase assembly protein CcoS n=1 Tax=Rubrivirga sp. S365 TaxID=3076080 RepID=UPI0028C7783C|nr:cbb3-type cytochrome oxidase assembly protein CcoS [Rubrivirga sp. S365]MDT7857389.1 cbb3-type cytochrome oxidase assembly protein CcoS [Rubrivirga sp. S365]
MNVLYVLVPLALALALGGVAAFRWAVRDGQFDDVETPALRVLLDDEEAPTDGAPSPPTDA